MLATLKLGNEFIWLPKNLAPICTSAQNRMIQARIPKDYQVNIELDQADQHYRVKLNNTPIKTPRKNVLKVKNEALATAIGDEWRANIGKKKIDFANMHLTSLAYTAIDNPFEETDDMIISSTLEYLKFDTIRFRDAQNEELLARQSRHWDNMVGWFEHKFDVYLPIDYGDITNTSEMPQATINKMTDYMRTRGRWPLIGMNYMSRNLKSYVLTTSLTEGLLNVEKAVELARLETRYQIEKWSKVDWEHDVDEQCTNARVSAGTLFYHSSI